uniref:Interleukin-15 receptor subunit alpha n=1 Tax=Bos indicus x Bos taurus TaxID=30522 RepID=A0A4W2HVA5_BOBOX
MLSGWLLKKDPGPLLDGGCPYSTSSTCLNLGGGSPGSLGFKVTDFHPSILQSKLQSSHIFSLFYASVGITCPTPTSVEHADIQVKSYSINSRERYVCNSGFKRKAGTSSLTQCVFNETAKVAHWTTPNLKCIRDPSLSHQRPPSTAAPTGLTPEPESPTPSGKEPDLTSKSGTKVATRPATGPGSRLPSTAPPVGTTGVVSKETTYVPAQTAAKAPEHTYPALQDTPGAYQNNPRVVTAAVSTVTVLFVVCLVFLLGRCLWSRRAHQTPGVEMESMESVPMTTGADARGEDTEIHPHGLGGSGDAEASSGRSEGPALPQSERT